MASSHEIRITQWISASKPEHPRISSVCLIAMLAGTLLRGQIPPASDDPISTDRPAIAASSTVVPKGSFQMENGFLISNTHSFDGPETSMRFGLTGNTELRFSAPDYYFNTSSGFGDVTVGMKQQFGPASGFDVSLIVFLSIPTGAHAVSSHGCDPGLQFPWSRKLSANWNAGGQFALYWPTEQPSDRRNLTGESTFLLDRQLTSPMDVFIEYAGDFPQRGGPRTCCISGLRIRPRRGNRSTSTSESVFHRQRSIISSGLAIRFDFRPFVANTDPASCLPNFTVLRRDTEPLCVKHADRH